MSSSSSPPRTPSPPAALDLCAGCGAALDTKYSGNAPRLPCPHCGSPSRNFSRGIGESVEVRDESSSALTPGDQSRDWKHRWEQIQRRLPMVTASRTTPRNVETIHEWRTEVLAFYVLAYHLKDILIRDAPNGITSQAVENAVTTTPALALLADLANLEKHGGFDRRPRSRAAPSVGTASGTADSTTSGWRLSLTLAHGNHTLDALDVAVDAVEAWRRVLNALGL